jgi:D-sedoheptulose 7-phosphate isomerase
MVFERQVRGLAKSGDLLIAISTSGNSPNVIRAIDAAHEIGCKIIAFTGGSGGKMKMSDKVDANLNVDLGKNSCRIQETHIFIVHMIVDIMERFFLKKA